MALAEVMAVVLQEGLPLRQWLLVQQAATQSHSGQKLVAEALAALSARQKLA